MATPGPVLPSNVREWEPRPPARRASPAPATERRGRADGLARWLRTPKAQLLVVLLILLAIANPAEGGLTVLPNLAAAVLAACGVELVWGLFERHRWPSLTSAVLSGLIVACILAPQEAWVVGAWTAGFAIVGKHVLRGAREHVFNPAALALLVAAVIFGSGESWWGALANVAWPWSLVLLAGGLVLAERLNKFPLVLTFLGSYFGLFTLASLVAPGVVAEMFRAPFVQSALFLAFFMLTDPPTSPNRLPDQVGFGLLAAVAATVAQLLGAGQVFLLIGVLVANAGLALRRLQLRRAAATPSGMR